MKKTEHEFLRKALVVISAAYIIALGLTIMGILHPIKSGENGIYLHVMLCLYYFLLRDGEKDDIETPTHITT